MEMNEIYNCCHFIYERLEKEIDIIDVDFYSPKMENIERYKDLLFFKFKELLLLKRDTKLKGEYFYIH